MKARQYGDRVGRKEASKCFFTIDHITLGGKGIETLSPCLLLPTGSRGLPFDPYSKYACMLGYVRGLRRGTMSIQMAASYW